MNTVIVVDTETTGWQRGWEDDFFEPWTLFGEGRVVKWQQSGMVV